MGSSKSQMSTAPRDPAPPAATAASNDAVATHDAATAPRAPGTQSTHATVLPLLYVSDVNECTSVMAFVDVASPAPRSSSASDAKSSTKMS